MKITNKVTTCLGLALGAAVVMGALIAQPGERRRDQDRMQDRARQPADMPSMEDMMAEWMKYAEPGEHHRLMEPMIGTFKVTGKMWMDPTASEPEITHGESTTRWVLGGRFAMTRYTSTFMGMPFEGLGITGYDRYRQQYQSFWWDTFGTMTYQTTGSVSPDGKVFTSEGAMQDPALGGAMVRTRDITRVISRNKHIMQMHHQAPDGSWMKVMELTYTRVKPN